MPLTVGSRGSKLALWQAHWVMAKLEELGHSCRLEIIQTTGDKITDVALSQAGSKGLFTKEIEEALLEGRIDLAVHSLKDMPTELPAGLTLAAIPEREDPRDALVGLRQAELREGARIGTSSLRRAAQLRGLVPGVQVYTIRGNVDTRLRKLDEGQFDAIVLASAGLRRLGWEHRITELFEPAVMCPAVGQGALAIETRADGGEAFAACSRLNDPCTCAAVSAERAALRAIGGGCQVPMGAHAEIAGTVLRLRAVVISPDGARVIREEGSGRMAEAESIGRGVGRALLQAGAQQILEAASV